jgi:hypothetical protein
MSKQDFLSLWMPHLNDRSHLGCGCLGIAQHTASWKCSWL